MYVSAYKPLQIYVCFKLKILLMVCNQLKLESCQCENTFFVSDTPLTLNLYFPIKTETFPVFFVKNIAKQVVVIICSVKIYVL